MATPRSKEISRKVYRPSYLDTTGDLRPSVERELTTISNAFQTQQAILDQYFTPNNGIALVNSLGKGYFTQVANQTITTNGSPAADSGYFRYWGNSFATTPGTRRNVIEWGDSSSYFFYAQRNQPVAPATVGTIDFNINGNLSAKNINADTYTAHSNGLVLDKWYKRDDPLVTQYIDFNAGAVPEQFAADTCFVKFGYNSIQVKGIISKKFWWVGTPSPGHGMRTLFHINKPMPPYTGFDVIYATANRANAAVSYTETSHVSGGGGGDVFVSTSGLPAAAPASAMWFMVDITIVMR